MIKVGDEVLLEEAWEDDHGYTHDEQAVVTKIYPDGRCRFRVVGHKAWRNAQTQAWINKFDFYAKDLVAI